MKARRGQRGSTLVEAAFITPIFIMLILATAEAGLYMRNYLGVANTVRAGARTASAAGRFAGADLYLVHSMAKESTALPRGAIQYIVVYKASAFGAAPTTSCRAGVPQSGLCNVYTPAHFQMAADQLAEEGRHKTALANGQASTLDLTKIWFGCQTTGPHANASPDRYWCPSTRDDTYRNADYVGVYMRLDHQWMTRIFGTTADITDQSVIRIEPAQT